MILFAFLSLILAASVPLISKKTTAVPKKTPHGVYICIAGNNGVIQETYNATNILGNNNSAASCSFNVPRANEYKVELYSAGAGGSEFADIATSGTNTTRTTVDRQALSLYNSTHNIQNIVGPEIAFVPDNFDFMRAFDGITVSLLSNTGGSSAGGYIRFQYFSPSAGSCQDQAAFPVMPAYSGRSESMVDLPTGNVSRQYDDYCKYLDHQNNGIPGYYDNLAWLGKGILGTYSYGVANISQSGGTGGASAGLALDFKISGMQGMNEYYRNIDRNYPFLIYLADLLNNSHGHGYYKVTCSGGNTFPYENYVHQNPNSCSPGVPTDHSGSARNSFIDRDLDGFTDHGTYKTVSAGHGESVTEAAAFRIPPFTGSFDNISRNVGNPDYSTTSGNFITIQNQAATGGRGGTVGYQYSGEGISENYQTIDPPSDTTWSTNYAWRAFRGTSPGSGSNNAENGRNASLNNIVRSDRQNLTGDGWQYYRIYGNNLPSGDLYPYAQITSSLSKKTYRVGRPGGNGIHKTYHTTMLGKRCTMNVPKGGPVLKMDEINDTAKIRAYENSLAVSIQCVDSENHTVFAQSLNGARYNTDLLGSTYTWHRADNVAANSIIGRTHTAGDSNTATQMRYVKPRWSRVFNNINSLNSNNVAQGGRGITVVDKCSTPKGGFELQVILGNIAVLSDRTVSLQHDGRWPGDYYQCYPEIGTRRNIEEMRDAGTEHYEITEPTAGGPAAVVISW